MVYIPEDQIWMVVLGFVIAFALSLGIGANDVANTFGTSVGAKVLTLRQACVLATIFETAGAVLLGAKVSDTVRKGVLDINLYENQTELFMVGNVAALSGSCIWLGVATFFKMPVSGTHSIIGAILGFTLVAKGVNGIEWTQLGLIVASWVISPLMSGIVSLLLFVAIKFLIVISATPLESGLKLLPVFYGCTLVINVFSIFYEGPEILRFNLIPLWGTFILSFGVGIISGILVKFLLVPYQRRVILDEIAGSPSLEYPVANGDIVDEERPPPQTVMKGDYLWDERNLVRPEKAVQTDVVFGGNGLTSEKNASPVKGGFDNLAVEMGEGDQGLAVISAGIASEHTANYVIGDARNRSLPPRANEKRKRTNSKRVREDSLVLPDYEDPLDGVVDFNPNASNDSNNLNVVSVPEQQPPVEHVDKHAIVKDSPETAKLFSFLQILTAIFGAFAHGGNDVSNAIGPVVSIWLVAKDQMVASESAAPIWILLLGGAGISIGLWIWGRRVIETMGEDLTAVTPSSGFCIEIGAAFSVLVASNIGIPVSSTHCKVGSIVIVGRYRSKENVDWKIFRNIIAAWLLTLPITGGISALIMLALQEAVPH